MKIKGISGITFFARGKRGHIYTGILKRKKGKTTEKIKVAIKKQSPTTGSPGSVRNEIEKLGLLNRHGIGPKLLMSGKDFFVYIFIEGVFIKDFIEDPKTTKDKLGEVIRHVFEQCYRLDALGLNKEEMSNPYKHIIITKPEAKKLSVVLIDFERCRKVSIPSNVTQFTNYIIKNMNILKKKGFKIDMNQIISASKEYKKKINRKQLEKIIDICLA